VFPISAAVAELVALLMSCPRLTAPTVTVVMDFREPRSAESVQEMEQELATILDPSGLRLSWRILSDEVAKETFEAVMVVRFRGQCRSDAPQTVVPARVLGITHITDGHVLPFSEVDCDRVRSFISRRLEGVHPVAAARLFGRALGRVLGHEVYHILARTRDHAQTGLAKALLSPQELTEGHLQLETHQLERIRGRFGRSTLLTRSHSKNM
jgi:hypothetical protein